MHADAYSMNKMMHIIGTIAIAVVACLAFSYLVNDDGTNYTIREDLVVGDYVEYEYNYYETQIKEKEMSTEDFIKGFQYDVSSMEKGDDVDFMYMGNNIKSLLPVTIGAHAMVGAGAVVTKDIPSGSVAAGNPAKVIQTIENFKAKYDALYKEHPEYFYCGSKKPEQ